MKTICVDARILPIFGMGSVLRELLYSFKAYPIKWKALVNGDYIDPLWHWIEPIRVDCRINSYKEQIWLPFYVPRCDLFWSPNYNIPLFPIFAKRRLVTMHDIFFFTYPTKMHPVKLFLAKHLLKKAAQLSHTVITSSHFSKNAICKYTKVPESKVQVIPLAINRSVFSPSNNTPYARKVLSEIYQVKKNFFLCVGRIADHKNQRLLCKAFIRLQLLGIKNIELVFIGKYQNCLEQQYKKKQLLEEFVEINEHMRFIGPISEEHLAYFYQSAECMVFPSMHEGFGLPPLEAMSSGCPCIVSNVTSIPEVCKDGALYFNSNDVDDLVRVVIDFLQHPKQRKEIIIRGLVQSQSFCWQNTSQQYISAIDRLISI